MINNDIVGLNFVVEYHLEYRFQSVIQTVAWWVSSSPHNLSPFTGVSLSCDHETFSYTDKLGAPSVTG